MDSADVRMITYESGFGTLSALREWERQPNTLYKLARPGVIGEPIVMHTNLYCDNPGAPSTCVGNRRTFR